MQSAFLGRITRGSFGLILESCEEMEERVRGMRGSRCERLFCLFPSHMLTSATANDSIPGAHLSPCCLALWWWPRHVITKVF